MPAHPTLTLSGLGRGSLNGEGSVHFIRKVLDARVIESGTDGRIRVRPEVETLEINFHRWQSDDWLHLPDLATLALLCRLLAEQDRKVRVLLPALRDGHTPIVYDFLERIEFPALLSGQENTQLWQRNIKIEGRHRRSKQQYVWGDLDPFSHYVPLRWFTQADFEYDRSLSPWEVTPRTGPAVQKHFQSVISSRTVLEPEIVAMVSSTFFMELGWNTVLHSRRVPGTEIGVAEGLGVFCAQMTASEAERTNPNPQLDTVDFCVADLGLGIPPSLEKIYKDDDKRDSRHSFRAPGHSQPTLLVDYAIHEMVTSRPAFGSEYDRNRPRGLATLMGHLNAASSLSVRSNGGCVRMVGGEPKERRIPHDLFRSTPLPGTQVIGRLVGLHRPTLAPRPVTVLEEEKFFPAPVISPAGTMDPAFSSLTRAQQYARSLQLQTDAVIIDLGYTDWQTRHLEYLFFAFLTVYPRLWIVLWNVRAGWDIILPLSGLLQQFAIGSGPYRPPLFMRKLDDARFVGPAETYKPAPLQASRSWAWLETLLARADDGNSRHYRMCALPAEQFLQITHRVNSAFVTAGFERALAAKPDDLTPEEHGFFAGQIRLLRGGDPAWLYYALTRAIGQLEVRRRWAESARVALQVVQQRLKLPWTQLVVVGFTVSVKEVLEDAMRALDVSCPGFVLPTFDVPAKEDLESEIDQGRKVILFTDVTTSGKLVDAVYGVIRRIEREVAAVVALVDNRDPNGHAAPVAGTAAACPCWVTTALVQPTLNARRRIENVPYWVDPVSLVPNRSEIWRFDAQVDKKITTTLEHLAASQAVACGHVVDGIRHTAVYVHVNEWVEKHEPAVREQLFATCDERLRARKWPPNFEPALILYPSGATRVEQLKRDTALTDAAEPAPEPPYLRILRSRWATVPAREVRRAYDPGGVARCETTTQFAAEPARNVCIVDDGLWRGTTSAALIETAIAAGARRILVVPLLARISPHEMAQYERMNTVRSPDGRAVGICYCFPFLLPIPYYGPHECPYEVTVQRMTDRGSLFPVIDRIQVELARSLDAKRPSRARRWPADYTNVWLRIRTYIELSSLGEVYVDRLVQAVAAITSEEGLTALFTLFVEEWRLLDRARLRQAVKPDLQVRAVQVIREQMTSPNVRMAAATLLRCHFRDTFVRMLPDLRTHLQEQPDELGRLSLQVETLGKDWIEQPAVREYWERICSDGPGLLAKHERVWTTAQQALYYEIIASCRTLLTIRNTRRTLHGAGLRAQVERLLKLLDDPDPELHDAIGFTEILAKSARTMPELASGYADMQREWDERYLQEIAQEVIPLVVELGPVLLVCGDTAAMRGSNLEPFRDQGFILQRALSYVSTGLHVLCTNPAGADPVEQVCAPAARLLETILDLDSTLLKLLRQMRSVTVTAAIEAIAQSITNRGLVDQPVGLPSNGAGLRRHAYLVCPLETLMLCVTSIGLNLFKHAFPEGRTASRRVAIDAVERTEGDHGPMLVLTIKNNGSPLAERIEEGPELKAAAAEAAAELTKFGGRFHQPEPWRQDEAWKVVHRIEIPLWL